MADDHAEQFYWTMTADLLVSYDAGTITEDDMFAALRRIPHQVARDALRAMWNSDRYDEWFFRSYIRDFLATFAARYGDRVEPAVLNRALFPRRIVA